MMEKFGEETTGCRFGLDLTTTVVDMAKGDIPQRGKRKRVI